MENKDREYTNDEITVFWKPELCIHATTCYKELIEVFNPRNRPWVNMNGAPTDRIIEIVNKCPTQALSYKYNNELVESKANSPEQKNDKTDVETTVEPITEVKAMKNGPLLIKGPVKIIDSEGKDVKSMKITSLCRCGSSYSMPYCDGTHRKIGFSDNN
jgi:uncharacterized Fe-S cluster protein YjdI